MSETIEFIVSDSGERLDVFLARQNPSFSRSHLQKLISSEMVTVNGVKHKANYKLQSGEIITVIIPEPESIEILPENLPLDILYEDNDIIVINKARGMVVHPAAGITKGTLVNALMYHCKDLSGINGVIRPGIVHRLDKDTSGVMVAAKNDAAHINLAEQIKNKTAKRAYYAVVFGNIKENSGTISGDIGRNPSDRQKMAIVTANGKPAITKFKVLERFGKYTLIECNLLTGRTHQIRVHMTSIGHPLVGDPKYGSGKSPFKIQGQALHSHNLSLVHPKTGANMVFEAPLPEDMKKILSALRNSN